MKPSTRQEETAVLFLFFAFITKTGETAWGINPYLESPSLLNKEFGHYPKSWGHGPMFISGQKETRSSSREVRIRVPIFCIVYFSRGTLPEKRNKKRSKGTTGGPRRLRVLKVSRAQPCAAPGSPLSRALVCRWAGTGRRPGWCPSYPEKDGRRGFHIFFFFLREIGQWPANPRLLSAQLLGFPLNH